MGFEILLHKVSFFLTVACVAHQKIIRKSFGIAEKVEIGRVFMKKIAEIAIILELNGYSDCLEIG